MKKVKKIKSMSEMSVAMASYTFEALRVMMEEKSKSLLIKEIFGNENTEVKFPDNDHQKKYEEMVNEIEKFTHVFTTVMQEVFDETMKRIHPTYVSMIKPR